MQVRLQSVFVQSTTIAALFVGQSTAKWDWPLFGKLERSCNHVEIAMKDKERVGSLETGGDTHTQRAEAATRKKYKQKLQLHLWTFGPDVCHNFCKLPGQHSTKKGTANTTRKPTTVGS